MNEIVESYEAACLFMQAHRPRPGGQVVLAYVGSLYDQPDLASRFPVHATYAEKRSLFIVEDDTSIEPILHFMATYGNGADIALAGAEPGLHAALLAAMGRRSLPTGVLAPIHFDIGDLGPAARLASARFADGGLQAYRAYDLAAAEFLLRWMPGGAVLHAPASAATLRAARARLLANGSQAHLIRVAVPLQFA